MFWYIPAIRLDGSDDYLSYDGTFLVNQSFTIFVVEQRRSSGSNMFINGTDTTTSSRLTLGYYLSTQVAFETYNTASNYTGLCQQILCLPIFII